LPTPEHREVAQLLLEKATGDLAAAELLAADERQADHVVGFHAQQAVEKSIKAVLPFARWRSHSHTTSRSSYRSPKKVDLSLPTSKRCVAHSLGWRLALRHRGFTRRPPACDCSGRVGGPLEPDADRRLTDTAGGPSSDYMAEPPEIGLVFAPQEEGGYHVYAPDLPVLRTQGDTLEEATANAHEALELYVEGLREDGRSSDAGVIRRRLAVDTAAFTRTRQR
jgi:predicted RNase H-like HicB family nuclease